MECNAKTTRMIVENQIDAGIPIMIHGAPGGGKSDIVRQIGQDRNIPVIPMILSTIESADLRGLPFIENGKVNFASMGELPDVAKHGPAGILFFDELTQAAMSVQNAAMPLILDRQLGDYRLPDGWKVVAAGNRVSDRAGSGRLNSALANRLSHVDYGVNTDDWSKWALTRGNVPAELVAFIRFRPDLLNLFNPDQIVNATPRTWGYVAKALSAGIPQEIELPLLAGIVGQGPASELIAFLRIWRKLPSPDGVLMNPDVADVPTDGATLYALCGALSRKVTINTIGNFCRYADRLKPEYRVLMVKDAIRRDPSLEKTPEIIAQYLLNSEVYL
jgi:hypothetical protein